MDLADLVEAVDVESTPLDGIRSSDAFVTAAGPPLADPDNSESMLVHPRLERWRLALLAVVLVVPIGVLGLTTAAAVAAMAYWLAAIGIAGLVAIVLAVLNSSRSITLTSSR